MATELGPTGGYLRYCEETGETYRLPYAYPFVIRACPRPRGLWDRPEHETLATFGSREQADRWLEENRAAYMAGKNGYAKLWVENWNE